MSHNDVRQLIEVVESPEELQRLMDEVPEALDMVVEMLVEQYFNNREAQS